MNPHSLVLTIEIKLIDSEQLDYAPQKEMVVYQHEPTERTYLALGWQAIERAILDVIDRGLCEDSIVHAQQSLCFQVEILPGDRYKALIRSLEEIPHPRLRQRITKDNNEKN